MKKLLEDFGFAGAIIAIVAIMLYLPPVVSVNHAYAVAFTDPPEITEADILDAHQEIFETLFNEPWDEENWVYPLSTPVTGNGLYSGQNHLNQDFTLWITHWLPIDPALADLDAEQMQQWEENGISYAMVYAILSTELADAFVYGKVVSKIHPDDGMQWAFMLHYYADPNSPFFLPSLNVDPDQGRVAGNAHVVPLGPHPELDPPHTPCTESAQDEFVMARVACWVSYNAQMLQCNAAYNTAMNTCNTNYNNAINAATENFNSCLTNASAAFAVMLVACLLATSFWGSWACYAVATALFAVMKKNCDNNYAAAMAAATAAYNGCTNAATAAHAACRYAARVAYEACLGQAAAGRLVALEACES